MQREDKHFETYTNNKERNETTELFGNKRTEQWNLRAACPSDSPTTKSRVSSTAPHRVRIS
jgi:hypothetical protein